MTYDARNGEWSIDPRSTTTTRTNPAASIFRNAVGRAFAVGQYAIAHDQPWPGSFPCRVALIGTRSPGTGSTPLAQVDLFHPSASRPLTVYVDADALFPSFAAIFHRHPVPSWLRREATWNDAPAARAVGEAFAVRFYLHHERYETLDRWLGAVDQFVDANTLTRDERADLDEIRAHVQRERIETLRRIETANQRGAASC